MSFLGCIGYLMAASGLQVLLELIYAPNTVVHMLSGKAVARVLRGHLIVDAALNTLVLAQTFNIPVPGCPNTEKEEVEEILDMLGLYEHSTDLDESGVLYEKLMQGLVCADQVCRSDTITIIGATLQASKESIKSSRTAMLWMQYMVMVDTLRKFIQAEHTGN